MKNQIVLWILLGAFGFMASCAVAPTVTPVPTMVPTTATPTLLPTAASQQECSAKTPPDIKDYATWTKVNPKPIEGHESLVTIYVNDAAKDIYLSASGKTFPVCAMIVKTSSSANSDTVTGITVMVKMPPGYDPEHHDWYWGMYDADGQMQDGGKMQDCIACHQPAAAADYVFAQQVLEKSHQP